VQKKKNTIASDSNYGKIIRVAGMSAFGFLLGAIFINMCRKKKNRNYCSSAINILSYDLLWQQRKE
jgi:hypothetical protein